MANPQDTRTNAADSAPGVDDGKVRGHGPSVNSKPGGRRIVWLIVGLSLVILAVVLISRPEGRGGDQAEVAFGTTAGEVESSTVPGTQGESPAPAR